MQAGLVLRANILATASAILGRPADQLRVLRGFEVCARVLVTLKHCIFVTVQLPIPVALVNKSHF